MLDFYNLEILGDVVIHYHGGPIWSNEDAVKIWKGRHGFVSFARPEQTPIAAEVCSTFALDNGAFSFWKSGIATDWNKYYEYVESYMRHPGFDWALIPDVIDGELKENMDQLDKWPFDKTVGVPVFHLHEPLHWLTYLCGQYPMVAIGSSGNYAVIGKPAWWQRMAEIFKHVCDGKGRPQVKLHGLRMLDPNVFTRFPFKSCDSTNVAQNCRDSSRWTVYKPPTNAVRGIVLAERIEAHNSGPIWVNTPEQYNLFSIAI